MPVDKPKHTASRGIQVEEILTILPAQKGTYLLAFQAPEPCRVSVGKRLHAEVSAGFYFYLGSAFGPGGLRARLKHHLKIAQRPHWHLDYLRPYLTPCAVLWSTSSQKWEHDWFQALAKLPKLQLPIPGFGSSDCLCPSHLLYFKPTKSTNTANTNTIQSNEDFTALWQEIQSQVCPDKSHCSSFCFAHASTTT